MKIRQLFILFLILLTSTFAISACMFIREPVNHSLNSENGSASTSITSASKPTSDNDMNQTVFEPIPFERNTVVEEEQRKETEQQNGYVTTSAVNLREGPSTDYRVITTVPAGETVIVTNGSEYWLEVEYGQYTGFMSAQYVKPNSENEGFSEEETLLVANNQQIPILMYHAIDEYAGKGIQELYVTPANFKAQMEYIKSEGFTPVTFEDLQNIDQFEKPIMITFDDGYKNNMNAYDILKELTDAQFQAKATIFMVGKKIDTKSGLSTAQLKQLSDSGIISIQSHTQTHPNLTEVTDLTTELRDIKWKLESITGKPVIAFAYPSGKYDDRVLAETKKYYEYAVTTIPGVASLDEPYQLKRIRINYSTSLDEFIQLLR
ncbi:polysaccharide deacetylase family protein [Fervidibacillus albus]|uniref:Polysaccharide deacetylase family protein n=1 Tax=Fervidibacillus albus TaxID=2980026 RepID=A0A9E8LUP7_9BACI|nr:polysaccharide deacetylase family protein [Fervidibacillus albus]WAA10030.1 polysaccharide deacetylase family protein [Fervidibacillus albus]